MSTQTPNNNARIAKNTMFLYIRMLLTMAITLYMSRIVLNMLGVVDYGIYNVVGGVVTMFAFLNGTISGVTQRFLTFEIGTGNYEKLKKVFNTSMCIHWCIAFLILILSETIGLWFVYNKLVIPIERFTAALWVYQLSVFSVLVLVISIPYNACIIAHEKMSAFAYISIIEVVLKLSLVIAMNFLQYDKLITYAFLIFVVQLLVRFVYTIYCKKHFEESKYKLRIDYELAKNMLKFTGFSFFGGFANVGMSQGINVLLNMFFGPVVNAARAVTSQIETAVQSFVLNFQTALNPQLIKSYAAGNISLMHNLIFASCKYSYYLLMFLSLPIFLDASYILHIWLGNVPEHTVAFTRILLLAALVNSIASPLMTAANATGNIKWYQIVCGSTLLIIVPIAYVFLKIGVSPEFVFGIYLVMVIIAQIERLYIVSRLVKFSIKDYTFRVLLPVFKVSIIGTVIPLILNKYITENFLGLVITFLLSVISITCAIYICGISQKERKIVIERLNYIIKRH